MESAHFEFNQFIRITQLKQKKAPQHQSCEAFLGNDLYLNYWQVIPPPQIALMSCAGIGA
jgi:hypothetical protein